MNIDQADPAELALLRAAFDADDGGGPARAARSRALPQRHARSPTPEPYRTFVAEISDGSHSGPPEYGLLSAAKLPDDWGGEEQERDLSRPFPLVEAWMWEEDYDSVEDADAALDQVYNHGSIVLGTDGCAMNWHLVVTGPHRGHVWMISDVGAVPFGAQFGFTTAEPGFAGWVRHWAENKPWYDAA